MIRLTRLNGAPFFLNSDLIEHMDAAPDTVLTLVTGHIVRVREREGEIVDRIVEFRSRIMATAQPAALDAEPRPQWNGAGGR